MSTPAAVISVLAHGEPDVLLRSCVDCGLRTGNFCDYCEAADRVPAERWSSNQLTPLCTYCDDQFGSCHFCRGVHMAQPPPWGAGPFPRWAFPATAPVGTQRPEDQGEAAARPSSQPTRAPEPPLPPSEP